HTRFSRDWSSDVCSSDLSLEDLATDLESLQKEVTEKKKGSETSTSSDSQYMDRITSLEAEQRQLKLMLSNVSSSTGGSNLIFWKIGRASCRERVNSAEVG